MVLDLEGEKSRSRVFSEWEADADSSGHCRIAEADAWVQ